jgi:hypothetical protein
MFPAGIRTIASRSSLLPMDFTSSSSLNIFKEHEWLIRRLQQLLLLARRSPMEVNDPNFVPSAATATTTATPVSNNDPEVNLDSSCNNEPDVELSSYPTTSATLMYSIAP